MPELPEVEFAARRLRERAAGRRVLAVEVPDPAIRLPADRLAGRRIRGVGRRGKLLWLQTGAGALVLHFRMTGRVAFRDDPRPHRLALRLAGGGLVRFLDPRRLGTAELLAEDDLAARLARLGPEPWPRRRDGAWLRARLRGARAPVKAALLDQRRLAGVGNIGACEACWRAGVDPRRRPASLDAAAWERLAAGLHAWVEETLAREEAAAGADGEIAYRADRGEGPFSVYGRAGAPCPRCGAPVARFSLAGRGTWACPACQE